MTKSPWPADRVTFALRAMCLLFCVVWVVPCAQAQFVDIDFEDDGNQYPPRDAIELVASFNESHVRLSWSSRLIFATRWVVDWGTTPSANQFREHVRLATTTRIFPLQPGQDYFFRVTAFVRRQPIASSRVVSGRLDSRMTCVDDDGCTDGIPCTADTCFEGRCYFIPDDEAADDGLFCNGAEVCDPEAGLVPASNPCTGAVCNESSDSCDVTPTDGAVFESYYFPESIPAGSTGNFWFTVRNTGSTDWTADGYALGAVGDSDPFTPEIRLALPADVTVGSDEMHTFRADIAAPDDVGLHRTDWQMVRIDSGVAGSKGATSSLAVSNTGATRAPFESDGWMKRAEGRTALSSARRDPSKGGAVDPEPNDDGSGPPGGTSGPGDTWFGEVAAGDVDVVDCSSRAQVVAWDPLPLEIDSGIATIYLGGHNMLGGQVGGTNPDVPKLGIALDENDASRPLPTLDILDQYLGQTGLDVWEIRVDASAAGVLGEYNLTVADGLEEACHLVLPLRVIPPGPHVDLYSPAVPVQRYDGDVPKGGNHLMLIEGRGLLGVDVFPSPEGQDQIRIHNSRNDRDASFAAMLLVLPTAVPGTAFDLILRNPQGQETRLPMIVGSGVWDAGTAKAQDRPPVTVLVLPPGEGRGRLTSLPLSERRIEFRIQSVDMPEGAENKTPPKLPPFYLQDFVAVDPESLRSSIEKGEIGGGPGSGIEFGNLGGTINFSIGFSFMYRWLVHFDAVLFSLAFDVDTGEFAPFIQGPPGATRLLGGITVTVVTAADLTVYGGCTYSTLFGWSCYFNACWSVVAAVDVAGRGYHISRQGCWFDDETSGGSDASMTQTFGSPGDCSSLAPCVQDGDGACVSEVQITGCCAEPVFLTSEGFIFHDNGAPVVLPFQWANIFFPYPEPPRTNPAAATVEGVCPAEFDVTLDELEFQDAHVLTSDSGATEFTPPHWKRTPGREYPLAYTRNATVAVTARFKIDEDGGFTGPWRVRGNSPWGLEFPDTGAVRSGDVLTVADLQSANPMGDMIDHAQLVIDWEVSPDGGATWRPAGASTNKLYVLLGDPETTPVYQTLADIGCRNAQGKSDPGLALDEIWVDFTDRDVRRVDGTQLSYYQDWTCTVLDTAGLLANGDGQCGSWAKLFIDVLKVQGIDQPLDYVVLIPQDNTDILGFIVQYWDFSFIGNSGVPAYPYLNVPDSPLIQGNTYRWDYAEVVDQPGFPGQGVANPASLFTNHQFVHVGGRYYDPSYGTSYSSVTSMAASAVAGIFKTQALLLDESTVAVDLNGDGDLLDDDVPRTAYVFRQYTSPVDLTFFTIDY